MGWKGTMRSIQAAARRAQREEEKRQRVHAAAQKQIIKLIAQEAAKEEVQGYENLMDRLLTLHRLQTEPIDWSSMASAIEPIPPVKRTDRSDTATKMLVAYSPFIITRLLGLENWKRNKLKQKIEIAKRLEEDAYQAKLKDYQALHEDWEQKQKMAQKVLVGDLKTYFEAIHFYNLFCEIEKFVKSIETQFKDSKTAKVVVHVNDNSVIPKDAKVLLKSGKLSEKHVPKSQIHEMYQDYVCSSALSVALMLFALLPLAEVFVTAKTDLLNSATGYLEPQPILSIRIPRKTIEKLNIGNTDPSDSFQNFVHNMNFSKSEGLKPIQELDSENLAVS